MVAVLAGTIGGVYPPEAYGFCTTCHGRDLVLGIVQPFFPGTFDLPTLWPLLTVVGVMAGAGLARRAAHERPSLDRIDRRLMAIRIIQGFVVMSFALAGHGLPHPLDRQRRQPRGAGLHRLGRDGARNLESACSTSRLGPDRSDSA